MRVHWRLSLDLGTNSTGWAALQLAERPGEEKPVPVALLDMGVRIYSDARDPQSKQSNAASRRGPRGARRNRDRYLQRRKRFLRTLIEIGLLPEDAAERRELMRDRRELMRLDPWILRANALAGPLQPYDIGVAFYHLQQRRGFASNRLTDRGSDESGAVETGAAQATHEMEAQQAATLGELKGRPRAAVRDENQQLPKGARNPMPLARVRSHSEGAKLAYSYYPLRRMIVDEFDQIWKAQASHHPELMTDAARDRLRHVLTFQRPLKPQPVGRCTFEPGEERAPNALPSVQRLRIYQELNHLRVAQGPGERQLPLTPAERDTLAAIALTQAKLTLTQIRRALGLSSTAVFSLDAAKRDWIDGDKVYDMMTANRRTGCGNWPGWADLPLAEQDALAEILIGRPAPGKGSHPAVVNTHEKIIARIAAGLALPEARARELLQASDDQLVIDFLGERYGLTPDHARRVASLRLPDGHGRLSRTAGGKVLAQLQTPMVSAEAVVGLHNYHTAVEAAGYGSHSERRSGRFDSLPYYGEVLEQSVAFGSGDPDDIEEKRIGKLANPTVHVALNQLRKLVNALIERFGPPAEIVVELARDLPLGATDKKKLERRQLDNRRENERRARELAGFGQANNYNNRMLLRLWEELGPLGRRCPFTGTHLSQEMLWSGEVEIEHILPFSRTLDDGFNNRILALREANRRKGSLSPWEAVERGIFARETIEQTMQDLPPAKAWRFGPDAMERFENEERDFLDRQLNDSRHISRLAAQYLHSLGADVWVLNGRLTADLRHHWGLNAVLTGHNRAPADSEGEEVRKNRNDHRNHAVDAFVIGCTDRRMIKAAADEAKRVEEEFAAGRREHRRLLAGIPDPFDGYLSAVKAAAARIVASHKPDHGIQGRLHEETNYGVVRTQAGEQRLASRKPITSLTPGEICNIGDDRIRRELMERTAGLGDAARKQALLTYSQETGHLRVRIHKVEGNYETIRHGRDEKGNPFARVVIPGENYCMDIVETPDGKWRGVGVTRFQAHQPGWRNGWRKAYPDGRLVMRVRKGDLVILECDGVEQVMQAKQLDPVNNRALFAGANEAGTLRDRHKDPDDDFRWDMGRVSNWKARKARLVRITPDGILIDPGAPA